MAAKKPPMTELRLSYSYGLKMNLGDFENADIHLSRSEAYDVTGMTPAAIDKFHDARHEALKAEIDPLVEAEYARNSKNGRDAKSKNGRR